MHTVITERSNATIITKVKKVLQAAEHKVPDIRLAGARQGQTSLVANHPGKQGKVSVQGYQ